MLGSRSDSKTYFVGARRQILTSTSLPRPAPPRPAPPRPAPPRPAPPRPALSCPALPSPPLTVAVGVAHDVFLWRVPLVGVLVAGQRVVVPHPHRDGEVRRERVVEDGWGHRDGARRPVERVTLVTRCAAAPRLVATAGTVRQQVDAAAGSA